MRTNAKQKASKRAAPVRTVKKPSTPTTPRVLIIDDSKLARAAIRMVLEGEFEVVEAEDGEQGWKVLRGDDRIRVVITDANMPVLDGYGLITRIRQQPEEWLRRIPIVMVTSAEEKAARVRALELGVTDFFNKPVYKTVFLDKVRTHVHLGQTTRKLIDTTTALADEGAIDPLTHLNSQRYFLERITQDLAYAKRHAQNLSSIFLEVDQYEALVLQHGDDFEEHLLCWLAEQLKETARTEDTLARMQGSRFVVTMINSGRLEAAVLGDRLRKLITSAEFMHHQSSTPITVSLCLVCVGRDPIETVDDFLELAQRRLARAKADGGNRMISGDTPETQMDDAIKNLVMNIDDVLQIALLEGDSGNRNLATLAERAVVILELADNNLGTDMADGLRYIKAKLGKAIKDQELG
jgi:diguanylate cyclase (GGDEF)-like protein